uniref:Suppressor of forked domain-containing protein n=1 Tax=Romanomermis culicivorax TaxID=13658 RepID=A0A915JBM5_ROMCU
DAKSSLQLADEISSLYERATSTVLQDNVLLYFAYADYEEERMKYEKVHQIYNRFISSPKCDPTLAFIQYMKFARRTEGIKSARTIFRKAREDSRTKCQIYIAAALMEYYCSKDTKIAINVFELGLKKFGDNPEFALAYIDFLSHLNEDNNSRVLFERILTSGNMPSEKSLEVWDRYLEFESLVGDLNSILKVDKRRRQALEKEYSSLQTLLLIDRYKFADLLPCSQTELRLLGYV